MRQSTYTLTHAIDARRDATPSSSKHALRLCVLATTDAGTRSALAAAQGLSAGLNPRVVVLVPHVVPYPQALDHPADSVTFAGDRVRRIAEGAGIEVLVQVCVCRSATASLDRLLTPDTTVLVGGTTGRWRRTREQRLAAQLAESGHRALFIDANQEVNHVKVPSGDNT